MSSREEILGRLRQRSSRTPEQTANACEAVRQALSARQAGPRPSLRAEGRAPAEGFVAKSLEQASTVDRVASAAEAPAAAARYLVEQGLPRQAVVWPALRALPWEAAGIAVAARPARDEDAVGITACFCAISETGTLMLCSTPDTPAATSLLPETHIALVPVSRIVPTMEEAFALLRRERGNLPRAVNFVSGPSRTGDIEQTIVLGAHGPARVHLILLTAE